MNIFYAPEILSDNTLPEEESFHCAKVLRMRHSDVIHIIDGKGNLYEALITLPDAKRTQFEVINIKEGLGKRPYTLHVAIAPTKNIDRFEWFVEKAVEIGVDTITPLLCRYSERKTIKSDRIKNIVLSATKQSLKAYLPKVNPMVDFALFAKQSTEEQRFIAHCYDMPKEHLFAACCANQNILVMIGPEGDFSEQEVALAQEHRFVSVTLSDSRLRTETAGVVAVDIVALKNTF